MTVLPTSAAVVVIGGGFAGGATVWALKQRGIEDVVLLERETALGRFASGRSAGLGRQLAEDDHTTALTVRGASLMRSLPRAWSPTGGILTFDDAATAAAYLDRAKRFSVPAESMEPAAVRTRWPQLSGLRITSALWVPGDGVIDVAGLLAALTEGARIVLGAGVERVEAGPRVVTRQGTIAAKVVVEATGAWAGRLTGDEPLTSYKRHVFVLAEKAVDNAPWIWHVGAGELYLRRDGSSILTSPCDASRSEPGHQDPDLVGEAHLRQLLEEAESPLADARITRRWACQRAYTNDRRMRIGRDRDRKWLVWAAGLGGHGATAAPAVGEQAAAAVAEALR